LVDDIVIVGKEKIQKKAIEVVTNTKFFCPKCKTGELYVKEDEIKERGCHEIRCSNCDFVESI